MRWLTASWRKNYSYRNTLDGPTLELARKSRRKKKKPRKVHKPRKIQNVRMEFDAMTKSLRVTWDLPTERTGGGALPVAEIRDTIVEISADGGANYTALLPVSPGLPQEVFVPDLEVGSWQFRMTVFDITDQQSAPHIEVHVIVDDSPPNPVSNVVVTES